MGVVGWSDHASSGTGVAFQKYARVSTAGRNPKCRATSGRRADARHATRRYPHARVIRVDRHPTQRTTVLRSRSVAGDTHLSRRQRQRVASATRDRQRSSAPRCRKRARGTRSGSRRSRRAAHVHARQRSRASEANDEASLSSRESAEASARSLLRPVFWMLRKRWRNVGCYALPVRSIRRRIW